MVVSSNLSKCTRMGPSMDEAFPLGRLYDSTLWTRTTHLGSPEQRSLGIRCSRATSNAAKDVDKPQLHRSTRCDTATA